VNSVIFTVKGIGLYVLRDTFNVLRITFSHLSRKNLKS